MDALDVILAVLLAVFFSAVVGLFCTNLEAFSKLLTPSHSMQVAGGNIRPSTPSALRKEKRYVEDYRAARASRASRQVYAPYASRDTYSKGTGSAYARTASGSSTSSLPGIVGQTAGELASKPTALTVGAGRVGKNAVKKLTDARGNQNRALSLAEHAHIFESVECAMRTAEKVKPA
mmetsp:Transcript_6430/g.13714  ORF Transcript_6430/g.13714 Transcript_6430/m.13714 type:complete len:177 (-) Transcript_6430:394-924(-)